MGFFAPSHLWILLAVGAVVAAYVVVERRRATAFRRFADPELSDWVAPRRSTGRRLFCATGFLLALVSLALAWARPTYSAQVEYRLRTVVVAIDVSTSMLARDVEPTRMAAARNAAISFVRQLPEGIRVGLVLFADQASITMLPTTDHQLVARAIGSARANGGTAIGEAIFKSLDAIAVDRGLAPVSDVNVTSYPRLRSAAVVLLSDGSTNQGRSNSQGSLAARASRVPVSTIAFGTEDGTLEEDRERTAVPVDVKALETIATQTSGHAYRAATATELNDVYAKLGSQIVHRSEEREITQWFLGAALALAGLAGIASALWFARLP